MPYPTNDIQPTRAPPKTVSDHDCDSDESLLDHDAALARAAAYKIPRSPSVFSHYDAGLDESDIGNINAAARFLAGDSNFQGGSKTSLVRRAESIKSTSSVVDTVSGQLAIGSLRLHSEVVKEEEKNSKKKMMRSNTVQRKANSTLILTSFPKQVFLGLDAAVFGDRTSSIVGVNGLPNGVHLLYGGIKPDMSRSGVWFICGGKTGTSVGEFFVRKWSQYDEVIIEEISPAEVRNQKEEHQKHQKALLPYNVKIGGAVTGLAGVSDPASPLHKIWHRMTFAMSGETLTRITGDGWNCWKVNTNDGADSTESGYDASIVKMKNLSFVINRDDRTFSADVIGAERTQQAIDPSDYLLSIVSDNDHDNDILVGELQFSYLTGMLVGNLRSQEQWGTMVRVLFKAYKLSMQEPALFTDIIKTIQAQMTYDSMVLEGSIFEHDPALEDDMKLLLIKYKSELNERLIEASQRPYMLSAEQKALGQAFEDFEKYLCSLDWDLRGAYVRSGRQELDDGTVVDVDLSEFAAEDERGEFAPVICDENGQEVETLRHLIE